jgi:hypothetical protein
MRLLMAIFLWLNILSINPAIFSNRKFWRHIPNCDEGVVGADRTS